MCYIIGMKLRAYILTIPKSERNAFAKRCGTSLGMLQQVAYGARSSGEKLAIAIERESSRAVTCEELRPDVDWAYLRGTQPILESVLSPHHAAEAHALTYIAVGA